MTAASASPTPGHVAISLCMIARDESRWLKDCLQSVRGVVDEVILVDTGSQDDTVAIAQAQGARVLHRPWDDDFAAPRNLGIQHARGDWVLILDADERLSPGAGPILQALLREAAFDCGMVRLMDAREVHFTVDQVLSGEGSQGDGMHLPRLLRRTADLAFVGAIHESVRPWLASRGMKIEVLSGIAIAHYGATADVRQSKSKLERNVRLLLKRCANEPRDVTAYGYLANEYLVAGQPEEAWRWVEAGWKILDNWDPSNGQTLIRLATARAQIQTERRDFVGLEATAERCLVLEGPHPDFYFYLGAAKEIAAYEETRRGLRAPQLQAAAAAYAQATAMAGTLFVQQFLAGAASWSGHTRRGCVLLALGEPLLAHAAFTTALGTKPSHLEAQLGLAEALRDVGELAASLKQVETLLPSGQEHPDVHLIFAGLLHLTGNLPLMEQRLALARKHPKQSYLSPHRRIEHRNLHAALSAYLGKPIAAPGEIGELTSFLASNLAGAPAAISSPTSEPIEPIWAPIVRPFLQNLQRVGRNEMLTALASPAAEIQFPGIELLLQALPTK